MPDATGRFWLCPQCRKHVPTRSNTCHCGFERTTDPVRMREVSSQPAATEQEPSNSLAKAVSLLAVTGCLALLYFSVVNWRQATQGGKRLFSAFRRQPPEQPVPTPPLATVEVRASREGAGVEPKATEVFERASPAVVVVQAIHSGGRSQGSGILVGTSRVVTSLHVVDGAREISVVKGGHTLPASVAVSDRDHDLALLDVPGIRGSPGAYRKSGDLRVGETVYAIGAPRGLDLTLSEGLISGLRPYKGGVAIHTTAALSPGSSGGGLYDADGALIGVTTFEADRGENIDFVVPIDWVVALREEPDTAPASVIPAATSLPRAEAQLLPPTPDPAGAESGVDRARGLGNVEFEREMKILEAKADQADIAWGRYVEGCHLDVTTASAGAAVGGRGWFAVAYASTTTTRLSDACAEAGTFYSLIAQVKAGMCVAEDRARMSWVYPGTRRDIRRKYRLDWDGWDRVCLS